MTLHLSALCFDTHDPLRVARFWADALGWEIDNPTDEVIGLIPNDGTRFQLDFCPVPEAKVDQNNIHLDLTTSSLEGQVETVERLIEAGGSHSDVGQKGDEGHIVLADPEGNELCIIEPGNNFLATCGTFGSITCDGSPGPASSGAKCLLGPWSGIKTKRPPYVLPMAPALSSRGAHPSCQ